MLGVIGEAMNCARRVRILEYLNELMERRSDELGMMARLMSECGNVETMLMDCVNHDNELYARIAHCNDGLALCRRRLEYIDLYVDSFNRRLEELRR